MENRGLRHGPMLIDQVKRLCTAVYNAPIVDAACHRPYFLIFEKLSGYRYEKRRFEEKVGYPLNLKRPRSFNEKMCWRKIYDRNPLFPIVVDKIAVRRYIEEVIGEKKSKQVLVPLIFATKQPERIPFANFPKEYAIKANHGSGMNILRRELSAWTDEEVVRQCQKWLRTAYGYYKHEWAYQKVSRRILIEELLKDPEDRPVKEYKLHMFDRRCELIQINASMAWDDRWFGEVGDLPNLSFYTPLWKKLDISWGYPSGEPEAPPTTLDEMLAVAEALSRPFDYIRVDFYSVADDIRIGEITPYHLSGRGHITPVEYDFELGSKWRLKM